MTYLHAIQFSINYPKGEYTVMVFVGLVSAKYKETKQFYTLYNTLDDTKLYLNKEVNLLNSIHDTFEQ